MYLWCFLLVFMSGPYARLGILSQYLSIDVFSDRKSPLQTLAVNTEPLHTTWYSAKKLKACKYETPYVCLVFSLGFYEWAIRTPWYLVAVFFDRHLLRSKKTPTYIGCKYRTTTYMVFGVKAKSLQIRNAVCTTTYIVFGVKAKSLQIRNAICISGVFSWFL